LRACPLYRNNHKTFEEYAKERLGYNRAYAYPLIQAAQVIENLSPIGRHLLSDSEHLCRELAKLPLLVWPVAWEKVLRVLDDKASTARVVKSIVEQLKEKPLRLAQDFYTVGDVFILIGLESKERKYNGCPCVAVELKPYEQRWLCYRRWLSNLFILGESDSIPQPVQLAFPSDTA
jgi:hypothetical protein